MGTRFEPAPLIGQCSLSISSSRPLVFQTSLRDDRDMGFNPRKMDAARKAEADKEAAARRATDAQVLEDAEGLIAAWNEGKLANAVLADNRRRRARPLLVPMGPLSGLPHDAEHRSTDARPSSPSCGDQSHSSAVVPRLPAERAVRRAPALVAVERHRRMERGTMPRGAGE